MKDYREANVFGRPARVEIDWRPLSEQQDAELAAISNDDVVVGVHDAGVF